MRHANCAMTGLAGVALLLLAAQASAADEPEIAVEASASRDLHRRKRRLRRRDSQREESGAPGPVGAAQDFDVVSTGDESRNQSSTFIFNGRVTQQNSFGHAYRFRLTPKRTGKLVIPAPSATIDGKTVSGRALALNVIAPEAQDLVVPEIKTDREKVYPTQPFEVTLRVLVRPLPDDPDRDPLGPLRRRPPHLDVNWVDLPAGLTGDDKARWLEKLLAEDGSGFTLNDVTTRSGSFFEGPRLAVFNLYQGRESRKGLDGRPVNYFVYELKRKLTAEKAGTYALGPAIVKGSFVDGMEGSSYTGRRLVAVAPAVSVEVREVPAPRPATFCGGIGNYRLAASASPTALRVGDPLTLTLDIERGPRQRIAGPDLGAGPRGKSPDRRRFRDPRQESHRAQRGGSEAIRVCPATEAGRSRDSLPGRHGLQSRYRKVLGDRDQTDRARPYRQPVAWTRGTLSGRSPVPGHRRSSRGHRGFFKT